MTQAQKELSDVRTAMAQLQSTLDESERQSHTLDQEKADLRKILDEREGRLEKLQRSSKSMAEELHALQANNKLRQGSLQSSRSSVESPVPRNSNGTPSSMTGADESIDYVYLKNVLLQFLEQKDKRHQMQLVPVLGMLLHFDK